MLDDNNALEDRALSDDGTTVVGMTYRYAWDDWYDVRPFRWTLASGLTRIELNTPLAQGNWGVASLVSADGRTVAGTIIRDNWLPFLWKEGALVEIAEDPRFDDIEVVDMSADGSVIAGTGSQRTPEGSVAFRWTAANGYTTLAPPNDIGSTWAAALSGDANVAVVGNGRSRHLADSTTGDLLFNWTVSDALVPLPLPAAGVAQTYVVGSNHDGSVIAGYDANLTGFPVFWVDGEARVLDGASAPTYVKALSADGSTLVGGTADHGATIWDLPSGRERRVRDILIEAGVTLDGWDVLEATGVSANGKVLIGIGDYRKPGSLACARRYTWIAWLP